MNFGIPVNSHNISTVRDRRQWGLHTGAPTAGAAVAIYSDSEIEVGAIEDLATQSDFRATLITRAAF